MTNNEPMSPPAPAFMGGTKAITLTPVVGTPRREYAEMFIPGEEALEDGELRVTVLGSGNPWNTRACRPLVRACAGVDLLIHECFPPAAALAAASGLSIERATIALNAAHTSPKAAGKVFGLAKPRVAGLYHPLLSPQVINMLFSELGSVYHGPVVQTQDLTVFNVTKEAVVARQVRQLDQLPPTPGKQRAAFTPVAVPPPDWWAEALIPLD
jgi:hypothetical protein